MVVKFLFVNSTNDIPFLLVINKNITLNQVFKVSFMFAKIVPVKTVKYLPVSLHL